MVSREISVILQTVSKKKSPEKEREFEVALEDFFQCGLGQKAAAGLSDGACVSLNIDDNEYFFLRRKGKNTLTKTTQESPDVIFWASESTMRHLFALAKLPGTGLGTLGVAIFERIFQPNSSEKIKFRVNASLFSLWGKGYFSVLKAGGPEVASYLAHWGFDSFARIKDVLQKIRG